jgi:N-acetylmuramoyl-L-alanine amidase
VALQVGHYKNNELPPSLSSLSGHTGAYGGGRSELELNIDVANRSARLLRAQGVIVDILPATVPTGYTADAFVALHADGNSSPAARGFKISTRWRSEVAVQDAMLVDMLTDAYRAATALPEDGNVTRNMRGYYAYSPWRPDYRVSNFTPSAIVEMGFVTSAADRAVMFTQTDKLASGVVTGILAFLKSAYGSSPASRAYGYGLVDPDISKPTPTPAPRTGASSQPSRQSTGDWQLLLMGKPTINVYSKSGGGSVLAQLPKGNFHHSIFRDGDYYRITLPNGQEGWIHRNAVIVQM